MIEKFQAIVLSCVRHSDRTSIVSVYTPTRGRMALAVAIGSAKSSRRQASLFMPLSMIEFSCRVNTASEMYRPSAVASAYTYRSLYFSPVKNAVGILIAEFLTRLLREAAPDPLVFRYISESLIALDTLGGSIANFHITFLSGLTAFMGIAPDLGSYSPAALFDMRAGRYSNMYPGHTDILTGSQARVPLVLDRLNYANMQCLRLSRQERASLLKGLLHYWNIHFPGSGALRSLDVLEQLFD